MNQKQLTKAIEEGINNSTPSQILKGILYAILIIEIIILGIAGYGYYQNQNWEDKELTVAPEPSCHPFKRLHCEVTLYHEKKFSCNEGGGCGGSPAWFETVARESICGYQEANAWLEQIESNNEGEFILECS